MEHLFTPSKLSALQTALKNVGAAKPKNCFWVVTKNLQRFLDAVDRIQKDVDKARESFVVMDGERPKLFPVPNKPGEHKTEIEAEHEIEFAHVIRSANEDPVRVNLHRIKLSSIQEEVTRGQIDPNDLAVLLGYIFVVTDEDMKKIGLATEEDLEIEIPESMLS